MLLTLREKVVGAVIVLLLIGLVVLALLYRHERGAHFDASLRADSALAASDSSKRLSAKNIAKVLGDSTAAWQRRVVQEQQRGDSLDQALGTTRKTLSDVRVQINTGRGTSSGVVTVIRDTSRVPSAATTATSATTDNGGIRQSHFDVKAGVFSVAADVQLPAPPARGTMEATVTAPSIPLSLRLNCGKVTDGVARADAIVTGPTWATVGITHVESDPAICNPGLKLQASRTYPLWELIASDLLSAYAGYRIGRK